MGVPITGILGATVFCWQELHQRIILIMSNNDVII